LARLTTLLGYIEWPNCAWTGLLASEIWSAELGKIHKNREISKNV